MTFYRETELGDLDNLVKPILDALEGITYLNDRQVSDLRAQRKDIDSPLRVRYMSEPLAMAFSDGRQFVHLGVWRDPDQGIVG